MRPYRRDLCPGPCRVHRLRVCPYSGLRRVPCRRRDRAAGHVRINGARETSPGHAVKAGDVLTVGLDRTVRVLKVIGFAERRGDSAAARALYVDLQGRAE